MSDGFKMAVDGLADMRMSVAAVPRRRPEVELRLRKVHGTLRGESLMALNLRQARALRAALDGAIAHLEQPRAHDPAGSSLTDAREASGGLADHDRKATTARA